MERAEKDSHWLDALSRSNGEIRTITSCMSVCDLTNDDYYKLIMCEIPSNFDKNSQKSFLRVYKGTQVINEQIIFGFASSVQCVYIDESSPKIPIVAVSVGPSILFYRNMKPYFKYTVPSLFIEPQEIEVWKKLSNDRPINYEKHINGLNFISFSQLTKLSQKLLKMPQCERETLIKENIDPNLERLPNIIAINSIYKNIEEEKSSNCLVITTDSGDISIMDVQSFNILHRARVCNFNLTPSITSANGSFQNDFRIVVGTREGSVCIIRKNWYEGREIIKLEDPIVAISLLPIDQTIAIVSNQKFMCFSKKGKLLWMINLKQQILAMTPVPLPHLGVSMICLALPNGNIQIYFKKALVDEMEINDSVIAMNFGKLGQEDHVLTMMTNNGSMHIKILRRSAKFSGLDIKKNPEKNSTFSIAIPKKTSIFVEQTAREKENSVKIHNIFQADLWRIKLVAAKLALEILQTGDSTLSGSQTQIPVKIFTHVEGLGPEFLVILQVQNVSSTKVLTKHSIVVHANPEYFKINKLFMQLSPITPGLPMILDFKVSMQMNEKLFLSDQHLENSAIKILLVHDELSKPLVASTVYLPKPENVDLLHSNTI